MDWLGTWVQYVYLKLCPTLGVGINKRHVEGVPHGWPTEFLSPTAIPKRLTYINDHFEKRLIRMPIETWIFEIHFFDALPATEVISNSYGQHPNVSIHYSTTFRFVFIMPFDNNAVPSKRSTFPRFLQHLGHVGFTIEEVWVPGYSISTWTRWRNTTFSQVEL